MKHLARFAAAGCSLVLGVATAPAAADIYTWVGDDGSVTYSDIAPPKGARLLGVIRETPPRPMSAEEAAAAREAAHQAEVRALAERIRLLEQEVDRARSVPLYQTVASPPPPPPACLDAWGNCDPWWSPPALYSPVVVIPSFRPHRFATGRQFSQGMRFTGHGHRSPR